MAKKSKLKFVSEGQLEEYKNADFRTLLSGLILRSNSVKELTDKKKSSDYLKELRSEISEYRKNWEADHKNEMEAAKSVLEDIKTERDENLEEALEEKKDLEAGFNDGINAMKEHVNVIIDCMKMHGDQPTM